MGIHTGDIVSIHDVLFFFSRMHLHKIISSRVTRTQHNNRICIYYYKYAYTTRYKRNEICLLRRDDVKVYMLIALASGMWLR